MAATFLILLGAVIGAGFVGNLFFERTRIPAVLLLIAVGIVLGPVARIVPPEAVRPFMPFFGAVALTIILFEGGLDLELRHAMQQAGRAVFLAVLSFAAAMFLIGHALLLGFGTTGAQAWAVAGALACTSAPIVIPVLARAAPRSPMRPLLVVESALSDALAVITVLGLSAVGHAGFSGSSFAGHLGRSLAVGAGGAIVGGLLWLWLLSHLSNRPFFYLMTIGFVFLLMGLVERVHGSGALAVLLFGMVLANGRTLLQSVAPRIRTHIESSLGEGGLILHPKLTESHAELSFMTRSFFFIYLGVIFRWPGTDFRMWLAILLVTVAMVAAREVSVQVVGWTSGVAAPQRALLSAMLPRGLATAVLASLLERLPGEGPAWETLATFVVVLSNLWMTLRLLRLKPSPEQEGEP